MKETQGMTLDNLGQIHHTAKFGRRWWDTDGKQGIARFRRRHEMADWTDTANARRDPGHFPEAASFAKLFKTAEFGHMKAGVVNPAGVVQVDSNFSMALDPGDRINGYCACHTSSLIISCQWRMENC